jgi:signal transduction histidine kinase
MCIKVDQDNALRAANRPRVDAVAPVAAVEWTHAQMQETTLLTQRLEDVARASGDWIWETDKQHRYTWVHGSSLGIRPPTIGELIPAGRVVNWLGEPELPLRDFHAVLSQGEPIVRLVTEEHQQGQARYVSRSAVASLHADGSLRGYRGSARDVTQSVEAKSQLWRRDEALRLAKEQAEASSHAKSVLVSKVGHELRAPLNAIVGLAQLIQMRSAPGDNASVERWIAQIAKTGWHMVDVLDMLMELGRAGAVNASIASKPVDVVEVVRDAMHIVEREALARSISIAFDSAAPVLAMGDRRAICQVVVNLLSNAIKYNWVGSFGRDRGRTHADRYPEHRTGTHQGANGPLVPALRSTRRRSVRRARPRPRPVDLQRARDVDAGDDSGSKHGWIWDDFHRVAAVVGLL